MKRKQWWKLLIVLAALAVLAAVALDQRLVVRRYVIETDKIDEPVRLAVLTDLHGYEYGPYGASLAKQVSALNPDAILLVGDMFSADGEKEKTLQLFRLLSGITYTYYVTGNHEYWEYYDVPFLCSWIRSTGVHVLDQSCAYLFLDGQQLNICGIPDPYAMVYNDAPDTSVQLQKAVEEIRPGVFTVLLAHRPELLSMYAATGVDLVVSGHAHGGQVRIPGLVNGLYAPNQGWFPRYAGGMYQEGDTTMIVSRGLSTQLQWFVPRVFNRPELVLVELN